MSLDTSLLVENVKLVLGGLALANSGTMTTDWVSLKNYGHISIIFGIQATSGTDVTTLTLQQATDVAATGSKALAIATDMLWKNAAAFAGANDTLTQIVTTQLLTSDLAATELFVLEIDADDLDIDNNFDCLRAVITDPGSVSTPAFILYALSRPKYQTSPLPSAIID